MAPYATALGSRFEGRLFSYEGRLHLVLDVDTESGTARVSYCADGTRQISQMSIMEIGLHLSTGSNLRLDGLNTTESSKRITQDSDGWYFATREGPQGPYASDTEAKQALNKHTLERQGASASRASERVAVSSG